MIRGECPSTSWPLLDHNRRRGPTRQLIWPFLALCRAKTTFHTTEVAIRKEFGIEIARIILGHHSASVTEIYAELDDEKAKEVMRKIG